MKSINNNNFWRHQSNFRENRKKKLNLIYNFLTLGLDYNGIIEQCPELTEEELNSVLWYFASRGLRYVPTMS